jgi:hypothetical protein
MDITPLVMCKSLDLDVPEERRCIEGRNRPHQSIQAPDPLVERHHELGLQIFHHGCCREQSGRTFSAVVRSKACSWSISNGNTKEKATV